MKQEKLLEIYRQMVLIRKLEEKAAELYQQGKIGGFLHLYIGQEAVSTGLVAARQPNDRVITAYRDHGVAINVGISAKEVFAEMLGKATGVSGGRGGSMHMADSQKSFYGGHAIVGAHIPIASGLALGDQYQDTNRATICMFGDGATNIGYFHEGLNLSQVWKLPVLWVCENNQYGMGTSVERASAVSAIRQKAEGYGIPNETVDGMDVLAVMQATEKALAHIRDGKGPYFLDILTYRYHGHSMGDPERYRDSAEIKTWQEKDPIANFAQYLIENKHSSKKALTDIDQALEKEIMEAVAYAESSPEPAADTLMQHIYVEEV